MTANGHDEKPNRKFKLNSWWVLLVLLAVVLLLSILALNSPVSQRAEEATPSLTAEADIDQSAGTPDTATAYPAEGTLEPLTSEEIGTTDGIILWSTILILILLVGTLRELLYQK